MLARQKSARFLIGIIPANGRQTRSPVALVFSLGPRRLKSECSENKPRDPNMRRVIQEKRHPARPVIKTNQPKPVRRFIRHHITRQYLKGAGWTLDPNEATDLLDSLEAAQVCAQYKLTNVELAIRLN